MPAPGISFALLFTNTNVILLGLSLGDAFCFCQRLATHCERQGNFVTLEDGNNLDMACT